MKKRKIIIIGAVVLAIVIFIGYKFIFSNKKGQKDYKTVQPEIKTITEQALAIGTVTPKNDIQVKSKISGIVKTKYVEVGDKVEKGDILVKITPDPTPRELIEAKRNIELREVFYYNEKKNFQRQEKLREKNLISIKDFEKAKLSFERSEIEYELAKDKLSLITTGNAGDKDNKVESVVRAPISGTILEKFIDLGDPVVPLTSYQPGTPLFTLAKMNDLIFRGTVDEIDVGKINEGKHAELEIGALPGKSILGEVIRIAPKAKKDNNATVFDIEIKIIDDRGVNLRAGYSANAKIIINKVEDVLVIPERLITFKNDSTFVEIEDTVTGNIEKKYIEIGLSDGIDAEIKSGIQKDEFIVERPPKEIE
ncbi:MAG: efflux RND transporter periplasmic adaptor subunit [Candidatus Marinimicrobia bacterium]|jgi:HlyD family secretion protein|nr:efflux RND transporter periplasmic adaptor subunit [Candidatus Neomarinimicrobiota bacterium]